jgi:hypothetical protein
MDFDRVCLDIYIYRVNESKVTGLPGVKQYKFCRTYGFKEKVQINLADLASLKDQTATQGSNEVKLELKFGYFRPSSCPRRKKRSKIYLFVRVLESKTKAYLDPLHSLPPQQSLLIKDQ